MYQATVDSQGKLTLYCQGLWRLECSYSDASGHRVYDWSLPAYCLPGDSDGEHTTQEWRNALKAAALGSYQSLNFKDALMRSVYGCSAKVVQHAPVDWAQEFKINDAGGHDATGNSCPVLFWFDEVWRYLVVDETYKTGTDYMGAEVDRLLAESPANWVEPATVFWFSSQIGRIVWEGDEEFFQSI